MQAPFNAPPPSTCTTSHNGSHPQPNPSKGTKPLSAADLAEARREVMAELSIAPYERFFDAQESAMPDETATAAADIVPVEPAFYDAGVNF